MNVTGIYLQLLAQLAPQAVLRQHALNGMNDNIFGAFFEQFLRRNRLQSSHVPAVAIIRFLIPFTAGHFNLVGIDDDYRVAGIRMGGIHGVVLTPETCRHLSRQTPQDGALSIHHPPFSGIVTLSGTIRIFFHSINLLFVVQNREFLLESLFQVKQKNPYFPQFYRLGNFGIEYGFDIPVHSCFLKAAF